MMQLNIIWILFTKEWMRLRKNPAALMAVGLIILMSVLVSIENKASVKAKRQENRPCVVVYNAEDPFIVYLKSQVKKNEVLFRSTEVDLAQQGKRSSINYPADMRCIAEVGEVHMLKMERSESLMQGERRIIFRAVNVKQEKVQAFSRWLFSHLADFQSGIKTNYSMYPLKDQAPTKTLGSIDLGSASAKAMVGAMLIFSAQYFLCCALFISFTAHERERGILQALALSTASPNQLLWAKVAFHLLLSWMASLIIFFVLSSHVRWTDTLNLFLVSLIILLPSLGLVSVATIITSLNRTQTSASLVGFCYLMVMGVIFGLAPKFPAFNVLKAFMFEGHGLFLITNILDTSTKVHGKILMGHLIDLVWQSLLLFVLAKWIWARRGWKLT